MQFILNIILNIKLNNELKLLAHTLRAYVMLINVNIIYYYYYYYKDYYYCYYCPGLDFLKRKPKI